MVNTQRKLKIGFFVLLIIGLGAYALFQSKNLIEGPRLTITEPKDGATLTYNLMEIKGTAYNISAISIDDRAIFVDKDGNFSEKLIAPVGYSIIKVGARDKFGKSVEKLIRVYLPAGAVTQIPLRTEEVQATTSPVKDLDNDLSGQASST